MSESQEAAPLQWQRSVTLFKGQRTTAEDFRLQAPAKIFIFSTTPVISGAAMRYHAVLCHRGTSDAEVAELADAHDSGSCGRQPVEVQVLSSALSKSTGCKVLTLQQYRSQARYYSNPLSLPSSECRA